MHLEKNNLVFANNSLPFCEKEHFQELIDKIKESILPGGYFVGTFFGEKHRWNTYLKRTDVIFHSEDEVKEIFKDFKEVHFLPTEREQKNSNGTKTYWHKYNVIYKRLEE